MVLLGCLENSELENTDLRLKKTRTVPCLENSYPTRVTKQDKKDSEFKNKNNNFIPANSHALGVILWVKNFDLTPAHTYGAISHA